METNTFFQNDVEVTPANFVEALQPVFEIEIAAIPVSTHLQL